MLNSKTNRIAIYVSAFFLIALVLFAILRDTSDSITLNDATMILENHQVKSVAITKEYIYLKTDDKLYKIAASQLSPMMLREYEVQVRSTTSILLYIVAFVLFLGLFSLFIKFRQGNLSITSLRENASSRATLDTTVYEKIAPIKSDVSFDDIGGISDVKIELEEIIDFMKNPTRYKNFGARMPRGVLLVGPPGVGKTMIAKAVANAANVPFYYQSGASFVQIYVGMGAKRVHELFVAAKNNSPAIIFIDEIDAVGKQRDGQRNDEREATLNQLLTEMDGFEGSSGIIVIAATNKIEVLDSALLRAGRFDRRIFVELPTKLERESILSKYLSKIPHDADVQTIANITVGFNGAALATLVNEAALLALRQKDFHVSMEHFYSVKDKVMFGKKKLQMLNDEQKAYRVTYQAGKVICATYFDLPFEKLMLSNEKLTPTTNEPLVKHELESRVKVFLAGIVTCNIKYGEHVSSAKEDLEQAKELVKHMIEDYGMGSSLIAYEKEQEMIISRLYKDTLTLFESIPHVIEKVEAVFYEREGISKTLVREFLDEVL